MAAVVNVINNIDIFINKFNNVINIVNENDCVVAVIIDSDYVANVNKEAVVLEATIIDDSHAEITWLFSDGATEKEVIKVKKLTDFAKV